MSQYKGAKLGAAVEEAVGDVAVTFSNRVSNRLSTYRSSQASMNQASCRSRCASLESVCADNAAAGLEPVKEDTEDHEEADEDTIANAVQVTAAVAVLVDAGQDGADHEDHESPFSRKRQPHICNSPTNHMRGRAISSASMRVCGGHSPHSPRGAPPTLQTIPSGAIVEHGSSPPHSPHNTGAIAAGSRRTPVPAPVPRVSFLGGGGSSKGRTSRLSIRRKTSQPRDESANPNPRASSADAWRETFGNFGPRSSTCQHMAGVPELTRSESMQVNGHL